MILTTRMIRLFLFLSLFVIASMAMAGCGTFQVAVDEGATLAPATSAETATIATAPPTESPTTRPTPQTAPAVSSPGAAEQNAVFYDAHTGFLLGRVSAGTWVTPTVVDASSEEAQRYQLYAGGSRIAQAMGTVEREDSPICSGYTLEFSREPAASWALAVSGATWDVTPYPPATVTLQDEQQEAVEGLLRDHGLHVEPGSLGVTQALRVDLEGDGTAEVVVVAKRLEGDGRMPPVAANDYALVAVIRDDNEVEPVILDAYPEAQTLAYPWWYELAAILDLNGDGRQELVVAATRYEGRRTIVYELDGSTPYRAVLAAGCAPDRVVAAPTDGGVPAGSSGPATAGNLELTPTPPPTPLPVPDAHIAELSVEPVTATPGDTVTVSWEATGESAQLCLQTFTIGGQLATHDCEGVPLSGSRPYPLDPLYRDRVVLALEVYGAGDDVAHASQALQFTCPDDWWFIDNSPDICPGTEPFSSPAAAQFFEGGQMIWIGDLDTFYVFFDDGTFRTYYGPLPVPEATPQPAEPPDGLHAPVSGFGLLWYGQVPNSGNLRERLGWALGPEFAFEVVWQIEARPERARTFLQGPEGQILMLQTAFNRWELWE